MKYTEYFAMKQEPFINDIPTNKLLQLPATLSVKQRIDYLIKIGGIMVLTGDVGIGKSTALRWALDQYHPAEVYSLNITANSASTNELYKQFCWQLKIDIKTSSKSYLIKYFKQAIQEIVNQQKCKIIIIIDEASLLRTDIFAELHSVTQFNYDSKNLFSLILAGQNSLLDKLKYRSSAPLASRVVTRAHLSAISREQMDDYINHHLSIVGIKKNIFNDNAISAIYQGSAGFLRKANLLARGAIIACMIDKDNIINEEHVRRAATELI
ncbi:MAG: AAA family ATPase [Desulfobacteraceae bacterium]|nr:AAA family ATPase [Desulfobacteraceae bacterium]